MKVELDEKGTLCIKAETPVESFALTHWYSMWEKKEALMLVTTVQRADDGSGALDSGYVEVEPCR